MFVSKCMLLRFSDESPVIVLSAGGKPEMIGLIVVFSVCGVVIQGCV